MDMEWKKGEFYSYRALTNIHIGKLERDITKGEVVDYDGFTLKWEGESISMTSMRGGIRKRWLVLEEDVQTTYVPQVSEIKVTPAKNAGSDQKSTITMRTVLDEERLVGTVSTANLGTRVKITSTEGINLGDQGGVPVARIKSAAKQSTTLTADTAHNIIQRTESQGVEVERLTKPSAKKAAKRTYKRKEKTVEVAPGVIWDMSVHWRKRGKLAVEQFGDNPAVIKAVLAVETKGVRKMIESALS